MTIGIDATMMVYQGSGVANYTYNLVKNLLLIDKKNQYKIFYSSFRKPKETLKKLEEFKKIGAKVYIYHLPPKFLNLIWGKLHILPIDLFIGKCDVIFLSDFLRPPVLNKKTKCITTIHDLTWKLYPEYHTKEVIEAHTIKLEKTIKYGDEIIVDSENTKNDLLKLYPQVDKNKVHVIYPGVEERYKEKLKVKSQKSKVGEEKLKIIFEKYLKNNIRSTPALNRIYSDSGFYVPRYILYVGAIEPRKNLDIAIKTFANLIKNKEFINLKFFIIGRAGWKNEKIFSLVKDLHLEDKVIFLGYVEDEDLPVFYQNALATIYLSEYEGFGLPPVESAYCETPVLLYKNSSLKELFTDDYPYAKKEEELKTLEYLIKNKINPKKYLKHDFSYKKTAQEFLKLITKDRT